MLSPNVLSSTLYKLWLLDQKISFSATLHLANVKVSIDGFKSQLSCLRPTYFGDTTLSLLSRLTACGDEGIENYAAQAALICADLATHGDVNHQALNNRGAIVLRDSKLGFVDFVNWASRLAAKNDIQKSGVSWREKDYLWTQGIWDAAGSKFRNNHDENVTHILRAMDLSIEKFTNQELRNDVRVENLCTWYESLGQLFANQAIPAALHRLALTLMNMQFCWPVQVTSDAENNQIAFTLPFFSWLTPDGKSSLGHQSVYARASGVGRYLKLDDEQNGTFGFVNSVLQWDWPWFKSICTGLDVGKKLWRSQNGRLGESEKAVRLGSSLAIDFTSANSIIAPHYDLQNQGDRLRLCDRSAEAYWVQVAIGLLLPDNRVPVGLATGKIEGVYSGEYLLGDVEGLEQKLKHAAQSGFLLKMILPKTENTEQVLKSFRQDNSLDDIKIRETFIRSDLLELNLCKTARDTADALQTSGWRRATFIGSAEARWAFSLLTRNLFTLDEAKISARPRLAGAQQQIWDQTQNLKARVAVLPLASEKSAVLLRPSSIVSELQLGLWLAQADHDVRVGTSREGSGGAGLGILCIRTHSNESDMRFWSHVFDALDATNKIWEDFQFGALSEQAVVLSKLLNNFDADPSISRTPAPDFLVILDSAGATQPWDPRKQRAGDERGNLKLLLNTKIILNAQRQHVLADLLHQKDSSRDYSLGCTRILVVTEPNPPESTYEKPFYHQTVGALKVDALRIFRNGFSIHDARAVWNRLDSDANIPQKSWADFSNELKAVVSNDTMSLFQGRGEYYFLGKRNINTNTRFDANLHEAAGLSFMPLIAPANSGDRNRRIEVGIHQIREATWHFQQMYAFAKDNAQLGRAKKYVAAMAFLSVRSDWDTVSKLGFDKNRFGINGFNLAADLITKEFEFRSKPHPSRFVLAINAGTNSLKPRLSFDESRSLHERILELGRIALEEEDYYPFRIAVQSELLFYFSKQLKQINLSPEEIKKTYMVPPNIRSEILDGFNKLERELIPFTRNLLHRLVLNDPRFDDNNIVDLQQIFHLQHGWLESHWNSDNRDKNIEFAFAACLTDVSPTVKSWIRLLALAFCPENLRRNSPEPHTVSKILNLWSVRIQDNIAFAFRARSLMARERNLIKEGEIDWSAELRRAEKNIVTWMKHFPSNSFESTTLAGVNESLRAVLYPTLRKANTDGTSN